MSLCLSMHTFQNVMNLYKILDLKIVCLLSNDIADCLIRFRKFPLLCFIFKVKYVISI